MRLFDEAIQVAKQDPDRRSNVLFPGKAYAAKGMVREAIAQLERYQSENQGPAPAQGFGILAGLYLRAGRRQDALKLRDEALAAAGHAHVGPVNMAQLYLGLGDHDEAFRWLDRAVEAHDQQLRYLRVDACWDPVRGDPRFQPLLRMVHLI